MTQWLTFQNLCGKLKIKINNMKALDLKKLEKSDVVDVKALAKSLAEKKLIAQNNQTVTK